MSYLKFERYETEEEHPAEIAFEARPWGLVVGTECIDDDNKVFATFLLNKQEAATLQEFLRRYLAG